MKTILYSLIVGAAAVSMATPAAHAQTAARPRVNAGVVAIPESAEPGDSLYYAGRSAINDGDYRRAAKLFRQVSENYPKSKFALDAMYWRAWSLYKSGSTSRDKSELDDASTVLQKYTATVKKANAAGDTDDLRVRIRNAQASLGDANAAGDVATEARKIGKQGTCTGSKADEEMRSAALDGLLNMSSEDALPILRDVLKQRDACRAELRKKAVFLISQKQATDIATTLLDVARNDPSPDVRGDAIFWLSQTRSDVAAVALDSILFAPNADLEIRKKAVFSLSQLRDERAKAALRRAAEDERMQPEIRSEAVFQLGNSNLADLDYFKSLFKKTKNEDVRKKVIFAMGQSSAPAAAASLLDLAKDKSIDIDMRKEALFWAGQRKNVDLDAMDAVYTQSKGDEEMQKQVLFVYSQRNEAAAVDKLMAIAKNDPNIEMRKGALFWLGQKNDPRVKQFIRDLINK